jgi:transcriptional regulator with GAF, ATPase, and Fis domain
VHEQFRLENVIGTSARMRQVLDTVERVAHSDVTALITGESGTGKELIARGLHFNGTRARAVYRRQLRGDSRRLDRVGTLRA